jgi:hypothetical protein
MTGSERREVNVAAQQRQDIDKPRNRIVDLRDEIVFRC